MRSSADGVEQQHQLCNGLADGGSFVQEAQQHLLWQQACGSITVDGGTAGVAEQLSSSAVAAVAAGMMAWCECNQHTGINLLQYSCNVHALSQGINL